MTLCYISIDQPNLYGVWKTNIHKFKLKGLHHFANADFVSSPERSLNSPSLTIPRYLLFNEKGEMVLADALRPSNKQELYAQILKALRKD